MMKMTMCAWAGALAALAVLAVARPASAATIAWVSFHAADGTPSAASVTAGFTQAPDVGYTQLLASNGHTVNRVVTVNPGAAPPQAFRDALNASDLVIVSRSVPSGHYGDPAAEQAAEREFWNGLTGIARPVMFLGGYGVRANRLGLMATSDIPDTYAAPGGVAPVKTAVTLNAAAPAHPIFAGVALDGANNVNFASTVSTPAGVTATGNPQLGISVVTGALAGGGVSLATVADADNATAIGGTLIGLWNPGSMVGGVTLASPRMTFLTGTRERGLTSEGSGIYDLTPAGSQLFLNAVNFMAIPEPSTAALSLVAVVGLVRLRRKR